MSHFLKSFWLKNLFRLSFFLSFYKLNTFKNFVSLVFDWSVNVYYYHFIKSPYLFSCDLIFVHVSLSILRASCGDLDWLFHWLVKIVWCLIKIQTELNRIVLHRSVCVPLWIRYNTNTCCFYHFKSQNWTWYCDHRTIATVKMYVHV